MATVKAKLKEIAKSPEGLAADKTWTRIEQKLNYDGRYALLNPAESMLRFGRLTNEESEYLGRVMGWDKEYFGGVDWKNLPTPFLAECIMLPEKRTMNTLSYVHPAPERIPVFDTASPEDIESFLAGELTFDELRERHTEKKGEK